MGVTANHTWELDHLPCPRVSMRGLDGSVVTRLGWRRYALGDAQGAHRLLDRYRITLWAEENLSPRDFVSLMHLHPAQLTIYPVICGPGLSRALARLARLRGTTVQKLVPAAIDEWVRAAEPENWWAVRRVRTGATEPWADGLLKVGAPQSVTGRWQRACENLSFPASGVTIETCRRLSMVHSFLPGDVVDHVVSTWCREAGIPVVREKGSPTLRLVR